jgi:hypothetical protein
MSATGVLAAALALALLPPATARADLAPNQCDPQPSYVRADVVDRSDRPNGSFVDSRCPGRELEVNVWSRYRYVVHSGRETPGSTITVSYVDPDSGRVIASQMVVVSRSGTFHTRAMDVRWLMTSADRLAVGVHHTDPAPSIQQDLIEYLLMPA